MRARQRHFNAGKAGALMVLDARFISGVSDGSTFGTWSDISGNSKDATQPTSTQQPTFRAAATNGLPAVESRTGTPLCFMEAPVTNTFGDFFCQVVYKDIGSAVNYERLVDKDFANGFWMGRDATTANKWGGGIREGSPPYGNYSTTITDGSFGILSLGRTSSTKKQSANGTEFASTNVGSTALNNAAFRLFTEAVTNTNSNVQISQILILDLFPSNPVLKRLQTASAYSFKIACS